MFLHQTIMQTMWKLFGSFHYFNVVIVLRSDYVQEQKTLEVWKTR